ncbi:hypothetical protein NDU88_000921 [Pleurodeles waltl]|uniref:Uncharacterized protein n=1 Tax=Pleurodeles waltl TaxID=8319 RepID=A0AAV7R7I0_PLEWA|nr:hypothetical protein NDU88_000921 [Pleurodeles waltl]
MSLFPACNKHKQGSLALALVLGYFVYLLLGATVFQLLEKQAEEHSRVQFQMEKLKFLQNYTCLDGPALEKFVQLETTFHNLAEVMFAKYMQEVDRSPRCRYHLSLSHHLPVAIATIPQQLGLTRLSYEYCGSVLEYSNNLYL